MSTLPAPIWCREADLRCFMVPCDVAALQDLVDRNLNIPCGRALEFRVVSPLALVYFGHIGRVGHIDPRHRSVGTIDEHEAAIWVLVAQVRRRGGVLVAERIAWFVPYMIVDDGIALSAGREIFGFPKELGWTELGDEACSVDVVSVDHYTQDATATRKELFAVRQLPEGSPPAGFSSPTGIVEHLLADAKGMVFSPGLLERFRIQIADLRAPIVLLRQYPAIEDGRQAVYKAIVEVEADVDGFPEVLPLTGSYGFTAADPETHPVRSDLGLPEHPVAARFALRVKMDFALGRGVEIWRASPAPVVAHTRERIAVLGGGMGALSFVHALTSQPGWQDRYDITVYQQGWRLGGQAASGRNMACNARNEEHGLHVWFGFYHHAFATMRAVYDELGRPEGAPLSQLEDGLVPQSVVAFHEPDGAWLCRFLSNPRLPGDGLEAHALTTVSRPRDWVVRVLELLLGELRGEPSIEFLRADGTTARPARLARVLRRLSTAAALGRAVCDLREALTLARSSDDADDGRIIDLLARFRRWCRAVLSPDVPAQRILGILTDFASTALIGFLRARIPRRGFDIIDHLDFREWLAEQGATEQVLACGPLRALYDASFAYRDGDTEQPALAAGTGLLTVLRILFSYEGAILFRPSAGLGEVVVAPMYQVLRRRGVRFSFFHRVERLQIDEEHRTIAAVHMARQATPVGASYEPLILVDGVPCWPSEPLTAQLRESLDGVNTEHEAGPRATRITLRDGEDFDRLVLGLGLGALPTVCAELVEAAPAWRDALGKLATVSTASVQLWLEPTAEELGWTYGTAVHGGVGDIGSWLDMSSAIARESWSRPPGLCVYGCTHLADDVDEAGLRARLDQHLADDLRVFLPGLDQLPAPDRQFAQLNTAAVDRYAQALPDTARYRLPAGRSGFDNLLLCGVWTRTGFHIASIESAVLSGLMACRELTGQPERLIGEPVVDLDE